MELEEILGGSIAIFIVVLVGMFVLPLEDLEASEPGDTAAALKVKPVRKS
ncbi:MAG TPA: hypothetical protein VMB35_03060 [Methanomicrobiales archaeon]|nr:hypothetical protein [Methanomicrobiales archaeon]